MLFDGIVWTHTEAVIALEAVAAGPASPGFVEGSGFIEALDDFTEVIDTLGGVQTFADGMWGIGLVPSVELFERDGCFLDLWFYLGLAEPCIYVLGGLLAVANAGCDGAIAFDHIAAGEDPGVASNHVAVEIIPLPNQ